MIRREIEDATFGEENDKYYYSYLKKYFLKENFYEIFMEDFYNRSLNYNNFINKLKEKDKYEKFYKIKKNINRNDIKLGLDMLDFNDNMNDIRKELLLKSPFNECESNNESNNE